MDRNMEHLAEVVVRLQQESIRFRSIMENIPKEHRCGGASDDVLYYIDTLNASIPKQMIRIIEGTIKTVK